MGSNSLRGPWFRQERLFRALYDDVRKAEPWAESPIAVKIAPAADLFSMDTRKVAASVDLWIRIWLSPTIFGFYNPLLVVVLGLSGYGIFKTKNDTEETRTAVMKQLSESAATLSNFAVILSSSAAAISKSMDLHDIAQALDRLARAVKKAAERSSAPPPATPTPAATRAGSPWQQSAVSAPTTSAPQETAARYAHLGIETGTSCSTLATRSP